MVNVGKPIAALCVSPIVVAKALENSVVHAQLTMGTDSAPSPYDIKGFTNGLESLGSTTSMKMIDEIEIDKENKIISAPCYMMEASIVEVRKNIRKAIEAVRDMIE
jgi:enhancing lycopene biosynthesis protein 2